MTSTRRARARDEGASSVEYGLLVALIAATVLTAVTALGGGVQDGFERTCRALAGGGAGSSVTPAGGGGGLVTAPGLARRRC